MRSNLQPKVVLRQQLICVRGSLIVQPMVDNDRDETKKAFSARLHAALDRVGYPGDKARIRAVSKDMRVSYEAARKWLGGESIPAQTNMLRICTKFKIDMAELRIDFDPESREFGNDTVSHKLVNIWPALSDAVRGQILGFAVVHVTTRPDLHPDPLPAQKNDSDEEAKTGS